MMDCVSRKLVIAWMKMLMMLLHMKTIHMKTNEDGKMLIKRFNKGSLQVSTRYQLSW
jgi:hypothetical protein